MMVHAPTGTPSPQESPVPMQSPLRLLAYALLSLVTSVVAYFCVHVAVMLYDIYTIIQWLGKLAQ